MGVVTYYFTYIIQDVSLMGVVSAFTILGLPLAFLMPVFRRKWGMDKMVAGGFAVVLAGYVVMLFAGAA